MADSSRTARPRIVPTILAHTPAEYAEKIRRVRPFARRIHIDLTDGEFASPRTVGIGQVYAIPGIPFDMHIMYDRPEQIIESAIALHPELITIHAEAVGDIRGVLAHIGAMNIRRGLAVLPETTVDSIRDLLPDIDHLMIFTGRLGGAGGNEFHADCIAKIATARAINPALETGVDGGLTLANVAEVARAGTDLIYVGGAIHAAPDPRAAYRALVATATAAIN